MTMELLLQVKDYCQKLPLEDIFKLSLAGVTIAFLWPVVQSSRKVYDITIINRRTQKFEFATVRASPGSKHIKGSDFNSIEPGMTMHYQVVPSWTGLFRSETLHILLKLGDREEVFIPVYNSGDLCRSRLFFVEDSGVRESGTAENDIWPWSRHLFGQQGN